MSETKTSEDKASEIDLGVPQEKKEEAKSSDVKIAEIWVKRDRIVLDACPEFYANKLMSLGILEYCKDIVKSTENEKDKPKVQVVHNLNSGLNRLRGFLNRKR